MVALWCVPVIIYFLVQARKPQKTARDVCATLGLQPGTKRGYGYAALIFVVFFVLSVGALKLLPTELLNSTGTTFGRITSIAAGIAVVLLAAGEELFFRGLIAGVAFRRFSFPIANLIQSVLFFLPHLLLLSVAFRFWPLLPLQFAIGWVLGWLRYTSGSILPGVIIHVLTNVLIGFMIS